MCQKPFKNDCFIDLEVSKLCLSFLPAVIFEKVFASYVFPDKNQRPLCMGRMQITRQAVAILSLISGLGPKDKKLSQSYVRLGIRISDGKSILSKFMRRRCFVLLVVFHANRQYNYASGIILPYKIIIGAKEKV